MADELKYHEQSEGWTHEYLPDGHCVCFQRPGEIGGGYVTVDFERRTFATGYARPRVNAATVEYKGKGWQDRIVRDALDHLERVMTS
ncbi:hypothetical protein [Duganella vulcania]|uniref:Uncharacterized protein n=1 Tax=Duganella vulcania TaxID=2692166 RepID=A0A845GHY3_9BURK|nr:hypothetical protein [Duganella vulcania]MYM92658.1 hypothetical protein [Duganella vulcania]